MNNEIEFCVFNLPVVFVFDSFLLGLHTIYLVLVKNNSTSILKWPPF